MTRADGILDGLVGRRGPGGCDDCNAESAMTKDDLGVYHLTIEHDDSCPWLKAHEGRS